MEQTCSYCRARGPTNQIASVHTLLLKLFPRNRALFTHCRSPSTHRQRTQVECAHRYVMAPGSREYVPENMRVNYGKTEWKTGPRLRPRLGNVKSKVW